MTKEASSPAKTPLSFAMGSLTAQVASLANEQALSRASYEALPDRIILLLNPRLEALKATDMDHEARIKALEKWGWKVAGGGVVILAIGGIVLGHPIH